MIITPETPIKFLTAEGRSPWQGRPYVNTVPGPPVLPGPWITSDASDGRPNCHSTTAGYLQYWWKPGLAPWVTEEDGERWVLPEERAAGRLRVIAPLPHWDGARTLRAIAMTAFLGMAALPEYLPEGGPGQQIGYCCLVALDLLDRGTPEDHRQIASASAAAAEVAAWASRAHWRYNGWASRAHWRYNGWKNFPCLLASDPREAVFAASELGERMAGVDAAHFLACFGRHAARYLTTGHRNANAFTRDLANRET